MPSRVRFGNGAVSGLIARSTGRASSLGSYTSGRIVCKAVAPVAVSQRRMRSTFCFPRSQMRSRLAGCTFGSTRGERGSAGFAAKVLDGLRISRHRVGDKLQGHVAAKAGVLGPIDHPIPPPPSFSSKW